MRILHAYKAYMPEFVGGVPEVIATLSRSSDPDFESRVIVARRRGSGRTLAVDGITVEQVASCGELFSMPLAPRFPFALARAARNADVVVAHVPFPLNDLGIALGLPARVALVVHWHSEIMGRRAAVPLLAPFIRHTLHRADRIVVSDASMIAGSRFIGSLADKCSIVPLGTDVEYWQRLDHDEQAEVECLREAHPRLVVATGRLVPYKGFASLIAAFKDIDATLMIIGEGALKRALDRLIARLGLEHRVLLKGFMPRDGLKVHLRAARLFAFPSVTSAETFGLAQIEAMAAGLPVVNTRLPTGVPKVARHEVEALTVPPSDAPALAAAIRRLLDDGALAERLGTAGLARARAHYHLGRFVSEMKQVFDAAYRARLPGR